MCVEKKNYRLQGIQSAFVAAPQPLRRDGFPIRLTSDRSPRSFQYKFAATLMRGKIFRPQGIAVDPQGQPSVGDAHSLSSRPTALGSPVVIGAGSHPFPFRTRKLSLLPPMVLRA